MRFLLAICACTFGLCGEAAELYKWVDDNGNIHYSDKPPPAQNRAKAEKQSVTLQNIDRSHEAVREANLVHEASQTPAPAKQAKKSKWSHNNCARLAHDIKVISGPVVYHDKEGNEIKTTERERQADEAKLRALFEKNC